MIKLKLTGVFVVEGELDFKALRKVFDRDFYKKENHYFIKGTEKNYQKLLEYFDKYLEISCYLFPLIIKMKKRNLKPKTKKLYFYFNKKFLEFSKKIPQNISTGDINEYIYFLEKQGKEPSTIKTTLNALKFFYGTLAKKPYKIYQKKIPKIFTRKEIFKLINSLDNPKHSLLLKMAYSCGLKANEVRKIKVYDIDLEKKILLVKGRDLKTSRKIPISKTLVKEIQNYIASYYRKNNSEYIFFSESKTQKTSEISERTIEEIFQKALKKAKINGHFLFSNLRDSFVVHLLEKKYPLERIIKILGMKKNNFFSRYGFYIKALVYTPPPDLLDFSDI